ncbi:MAG: hypothetical protein HUK40_13910 [Desulfobacter sp.]|nr:hypothetical protein [Desulfobacter sp.]WDP87756.1 MAG: hypothetical protein HUN05_23630 [Desulfobacter sp.]
MTVNAEFLSTQIPLFEKRFSLAYQRDDSCIEYVLDAKETSRQVSLNLILSWDTRTRGVYVSKFYPQLYLEAGSKYLSAACFYLMVSHGVHEFGLEDGCAVWLETDSGVFNDFYVKLKEFEFSVSRARVGNKVCLAGIFHELFIKTGPIPRIETLFDRF